MAKVKNIEVLMCCSDLSVKGGMVSVVKNYLSYPKWNEFSIRYIPTHIEKGKMYRMLFFFFSYIRILFTFIWHKPDIVYLHMSERGSVYRKAYILRTAKKFGIQTIIHHHGAEFEDFYTSLNEKGKRYVSSILEKADLNIVLSKSLAGMITEKAPNARVKVLYNAVDVPESNPYKNNSTKILFLGRLGERKGIYDLLETIMQLDETLDERYSFCLCGDGDIEKVKKTIRSMGIQRRISHIGWIDKAEKEQLLNETVLHVLPSYHEGLPMSILETMAHGIPNISTRIASIPEVIAPGENGYLIEPGDTDSLTDAVADALQNPETRQRMSESSYRLIRDCFSLDACVAMLKSIFYDLIEEEKR